MQVFNPEETFKLLILGWWGIVFFSLFGCFLFVGWGLLCFGGFVLVYI